MAMDDSVFASDEPEKMFTRKFKRPVTDKAKTIKKLEKFVRANIDWGYELSSFKEKNIIGLFFEYESVPVWIYKHPTHYLVKTPIVSKELMKQLRKFT